MLREKLQHTTKSYNNKPVLPSALQNTVTNRVANMCIFGSFLFMKSSCKNKGTKFVKVNNLLTAGMK